MSDARTPEHVRGLDDHGPLHAAAETQRADVASVRGVRASWDEWIEDHGNAWPADDDAPDAFLRITH